MHKELINALYDGCNFFAAEVLKSMFTKIINLHSVCLGNHFSSLSDYLKKNPKNASFCFRLVMLVTCIS